MKCCDMKGYLTFLILWILKENSLTGAQIAKELEKRRGTKPSPGTIYPALKELKEKKLVISNNNKVYSLTKEGENELKCACGFLKNMFYDVKKMFTCCDKK